MTDSPGAILAKLESMAKSQDKQETHLLRMEDAHGERLFQIEKMISTIAVQNEQISSIKAEQKVQWKNINEHKGIISDLKLFQATCPAQNTKFHLVGMWAAITLFGGIIAMVFNSVINQADKLAAIVKGIHK